jgi:hypothetical protein
MSDLVDKYGIIFALLLSKLVIFQFDNLITFKICMNCFLYNYTTFWTLFVTF